MHIENINKPFIGNVRGSFINNDSLSNKPYTVPKLLMSIFFLVSYFLSFFYIDTGNNVAEYLTFSYDHPDLNYLYGHTHMVHIQRV